MTPHRTDLVLGVAVILFGGAYLGSHLDVARFLSLPLLWATCAIVIRLWNSGRTSYRVIAAILHLPVLLQFMMPKHLRSAVVALPSERAGKDALPLSTGHLNDQGLDRHD